VYGDPAATGKPAGDDLVEGKRTVLVALALDGAPAGDAARLDAALGTSLTDDEVAQLRRIIDESGAHAHVEKVIGELVGVALARLDASSVVDPARQVLRDLAAAATDRVV
jgi:geranylgeranyl diphosphate synthase type I